MTQSDIPSMAWVLGAQHPQHPPDYPTSSQLSRVQQVPAAAGLGRSECTKRLLSPMSVMGRMARCAAYFARINTAVRQSPLGQCIHTTHHTPPCNHHRALGTHKGLLSMSRGGSRHEKKRGVKRKKRGLLYLGGKRRTIDESDRVNTTLIHTACGCIGTTKRLQRDPKKRETHRLKGDQLEMEKHTYHLPLLALQ